MPEVRTTTVHEVRINAEPVRPPETPQDRVVIAALWSVALVVMGSWALAIVAALRWLL